MAEVERDLGSSYSVDPVGCVLVAATFMLGIILGFVIGLGF